MQESDAAATRHDEVLPPVIVVVQDLDSAGLEAARTLYRRDSGAIGREGSLAAVSPELRSSLAGEKNVQPAVIVEITHSDGTAEIGSEPTLGGHVGKALQACVSIEHAGAVLASDEQIDAAVGVEVADGRVTRARGTANPGPRERAVEIVAVHAVHHASIPNHEQIEIAIVIEVDERGRVRPPDVGDARTRSDILERAASRVAEQIAVCIAADGEEVKPAIVVEVGEGRVDGTGGKGGGDARSFGDVHDVSALNAVQTRHRPPLIGGRD